MSIGMIMEKQSMETMQDCATHTKTASYEDVYERDFETRFDKANYEINRPIRMGKNKKVIKKIKDVLSECIDGWCPAFLHK